MGRHLLFFCHRLSKSYLRKKKQSISYVSFNVNLFQQNQANQTGKERFLKNIGLIRNGLVKYWKRQMLTFSKFQYLYYKIYLLCIFNVPILCFYVCFFFSVELHTIYTLITHYLTFIITRFIIVVLITYVKISKVHLFFVELR